MKNGDRISRSTDALSDPKHLPPAPEPAHILEYTRHSLFPISTFVYGRIPRVGRRDWVIFSPYKNPISLAATPVIYRFGPQFGRCICFYGETRHSSAIALPKLGTPEEIKRATMHVTHQPGDCMGDRHERLKKRQCKVQRIF